MPPTVKRTDQAQDVTEPNPTHRPALAGAGARGTWARGLLPLLAILVCGQGCATIRVTDPPRTASEQFLLSGAVTRAVGQLSFNELRDRIVWVESNTLVAG